MYIATKGAVRLLTKATALEHVKDNSRCNSVYPGGVDTPMVQDVPDDPARQGRTPLGRRAAPEEIAYGVLSLASDASSFMTGSEMVIDGGRTAQEVGLLLLRCQEMVARRVRVVPSTSDAVSPAPYEGEGIRLAGILELAVGAGALCLTSTDTAPLQRVGTPMQEHPPRSAAGHGPGPLAPTANGISGRHSHRRS